MTSKAALWLSVLRTEKNSSPSNVSRGRGLSDCRNIGQGEKSRAAKRSVRCVRLSSRPAVADLPRGLVISLLQSHPSVRSKSTPNRRWVLFPRAGYSHQVNLERRTSSPSVPLRSARMRACMQWWSEAETVLHFLRAAVLAHPERMGRSLTRSVVERQKERAMARRKGRWASSLLLRNENNQRDSGYAQGKRIVVSNGS